MGLRDRLDKLTGGEDSFDGETRTGNVDYEDFAEAVECLGEMMLYPYAAQEVLEQDGSNDAQIRAEIMEEIASNSIDTVGVFDIIEVCERNGIDFKEEVLQQT